MPSPRRVPLTDSAFLIGLPSHTADYLAAPPQMRAKVWRLALSDKQVAIGKAQKGRDRMALSLLLSDGSAYTANLVSR